MVKGLRADHNTRSSKEETHKGESNERIQVSSEGGR